MFVKDLFIGSSNLEISDFNFLGIDELFISASNEKYPDGDTALLMGEGDFRFVEEEGRLL